MNNQTKSKITDPNRILTLANVVSLLRALIAVPIIYSMLRPEWWLITLVLIILAIASDALDGYFARRAHEVTHLGKWLDPVADFIVIISVTYFLVLFDQFPLWFFIFFTIRYLFIALPAVYLINHSQFILSSNLSGKWAAGITALTIAFHIFPIPSLEIFRITTLWLAFFLLAISWWFYIRTFMIELRKL